MLSETESRRFRELMNDPGTVPTPGELPDYLESCLGGYKAALSLARAANDMGAQAEAMMWIAIILSEDQPGLALRWYRKLLRLAPSQEAWAGLGKCLVALRRYREARSALTQAADSGDKSAAETLEDIKHLGRRTVQ